MADINPESNDTPEIPSFKPTRKPADEEKGGAGPLSGLGKAKPSPLSGLGKPSAVGTKGSLPATGGGGFKFPGFGGGKQGDGGMKIRGMSGAGGSLLDRIKNLRRKDVMFIGAGLATLMMAPVAEHFMMTPDDRNSGGLEEGFDSKGPLFPDGSTVYEGGTGGFSPGNQIGMGTDVITPLNVRDPSALVMGPGARQKAEAVVESPPPATTSSDDEGSASKWKDALAESAKSGVQEAVKKTPKLPTPSIKMQGALRGLSALSGGGSGTKAQMQLAKLDASNVPNRARGSNSLTASQAAPGFRGAARRSNASGSGIEGLRAAAGGQADIFSRAGASDGLQTAANVALPFPGGGGYGGFGGPGGDSGPGKNGGGNQIKENKQLGESLEFLRRKMEQEKAIGLKWKKKEWNQFGRKKAIEEGGIKLMFDSFGKIIVDPISEMAKKLAGQMVEPSGAAATGVRCIKGTPPSVSVVSYTDSGDNKYRCSGTSVERAGKDGGWGQVTTCDQCDSLGGTPAAPGTGEGNRSEDSGSPWEQELGPTRPSTTPSGNIYQICETIKSVAKADAGPAFEATKKRFLGDAQRLAAATMNLSTEKGSGATCLAGAAFDADFVKLGDAAKTYTGSDFSSIVNGVQTGLRGTQRELSAKHIAAEQLAKGEVRTLGDAKTAVAAQAEGAALDNLEAKITEIKKLAKGPDNAKFAEIADRVGNGTEKIKAAGEIDFGGDSGKLETKSLDELQAEIAKQKEAHVKAHEALEKLGQQTLGPLESAVPSAGLSDDAKKTLEEYKASLDNIHGKLSGDYSGVLSRSNFLKSQHDLAETARGEVGTMIDALAQRGGDTQTEALKASAAAEPMARPSYVTTTPGTPPVESLNETQWTTDTGAVTAPLETAAKKISPQEAGGLLNEFEKAGQAVRAINPGRSGT